MYNIFLHLHSASNYSCIANATHSKFIASFKIPCSDPPIIAADFLFIILYKYSIRQKNWRFAFTISNHKKLGKII